MTTLSTTIPSTKTVEERAEEYKISNKLAQDFMKSYAFDCDPEASRKYLADVAAGDIEKYNPLTRKYNSLEDTFNSPISVPNKCRFCDRIPTKDDDRTSLMRCSACLAVRYCNRECQSKDWKFHKKGCKLIRSDPKGLGDKLISPTQS